MHVLDFLVRAVTRFENEIKTECSPVLKWLFFIYIFWGVGGGGGGGSNYWGVHLLDCTHARKWATSSNSKTIQSIPSGIDSTLWPCNYHGDFRFNFENVESNNSSKPRNIVDILT